MADIADFGASLQPLVREAWQQRVSLLRTQQSILHAFNVVYGMYSHANPDDTASTLDSQEFGERLAGEAGGEGFLLKQQGDFTFAYRANKVNEACRFYLNAGTLAHRLTVAGLLMQKLKHLERNAFEFKVLHSNTNRSDNVVIYVRRDDLAAIKALLRGIDWQGCLRAEIPAGTKQVL